MPNKYQWVIFLALVIILLVEIISFRFSSKYYINYFSYVGLTLGVGIVLYKIADKVGGKLER